LQGKRDRERQALGVIAFPTFAIEPEGLSPQVFANPWKVRGNLAVKGEIASVPSQ